MRFNHYFYKIIFFLLVFVISCKKDSSIEPNNNVSQNTDTLATFLLKMEGNYKVKVDSVLWGPPSYSGSFGLGIDTISIIKSVGDTIMAEGHKLYYNIYSTVPYYSSVPFYPFTSKHSLGTDLYYTLDYYLNKDSIVYTIHYPSGLGGGIYSTYKGVRIK